MEDQSIEARLQKIAEEYEKDFVCSECGSTLKIEVTFDGLHHLAASCKNPECCYSEEQGRRRWGKDYGGLRPEYISIYNNQEVMLDGCLD